MSTVLFGELMILLLLLVATLRPFFRNYYDEHDNTVVIAPGALALSLMLLFGSGVSVSAIAVLVPSALVFVLNFRSFLRFCSQLKIDGYTGVFKVFSFLCFLITVASGVLLFGMYPRYDSAHLKRIFGGDIEQTSYNVTGSFTGGFDAKTQFTQRTAARFYTFCPKGLTHQEKLALPLVVFIPDVYATVSENAPTIQAIARNGNMVIAADFFCTDNFYNTTADSKNKSRARSFTLRKMRIFSPEDETLLRPAWTTLKEQETELVYRFALRGAWKAENGEQTWAEKARASWEENTPDWANTRDTKTQTATDTAAITEQSGAQPKANNTHDTAPFTGLLPNPAEKAEHTHGAPVTGGNAAEQVAALEQEQSTAELLPKSTVLPTAELPSKNNTQTATANTAGAAQSAAHTAKTAGKTGAVALIVTDGDASTAAERFLHANRLDTPLLVANETVPGYIKGMGNLAVLQPAVYRYIAPTVTDGTIQAQQIASRAEKAKAR